MSSQLKKQALTGGLATAISQWLIQVSRVVSTIVLARLLTPDDFGLVGMIIVLTSAGERFKDLGLDVPTIQKKEISDDEINELFWLNAAIGWALTLGFILLSPALAWFYGDPRLISMSIIFSLSLALGGLTVQHQALLRRRMQFSRLGLVQTISVVGSAVVGIVMAYVGFGYWSLVWKDVFRAVAILIGTWMVCGWLPGRPRISRPTFNLLRTGGHVTGFNVVHFLSRSFDQILLGKFAGVTVLGLYRQAYQLLMLPISLLRFPLEYVMMPVLSRLQDEPERFRRYYVKAVSLLSFVWMPAVVFLGVFSKQLVTLLLGEKWAASADIFTILAIAAFVEPIVATAGSIMMARGDTNRYFWWGAGNSAFLVAAFSVGVIWGARGVAIGYVIFTYASIFPSLYIAFRGSLVTAYDFAQAIAYPAFASLITGSLLWAFRAGADGYSPMVMLVAGSIIALVVYSLTFLLVSTGRSQLKECRSVFALVMSEVASRVSARS